MNRFRKGFTIIELSVTIVILGILIGVSILSFSNSRSRNIIDTKANSIKNLYVRINKTAVISGKDCQIVIDKNNSVILGLQGGSVIQGDSIFIDPNRFSIIIPNNTLTFTITPGGRVNTTDSTRTFVLRDTKTNRVKNIFISPLGVMEVK